MKRKLDPKKLFEEIRKSSKEFGKLNRAKNVSMAKKAGFLAREMKSDLCFMQERCIILEEENQRFRDGFIKGVPLKSFDEGITMSKPNLNDYISVTRKNFLSDDNEGRMVEKTFLEIQGTFLVKIRDNTFNGTIGENTIGHIEIFLKVVGPLKIKGVSQDRFRSSVFPISLEGAAYEWFKKDCIGLVTTWEDLVEKFIQKFYHLSYNNEEIEANEDNDSIDVAEIFKIEGGLFNYETPLCKAFNELKYLLKIDTNLFAYDIQEIKTYEEYELNTTGDLEEPWTDNKRTTRTGSSRCMTYFQDHKWYDELVDGVPKEEALIHKATFEESWGDATPGVMKFCAWLKNSLENFHKLDYDVLVKLEECWWKVNTHEHAPFTRWENHGRGPYANAKTEKTYDPYLDINCIFGRNYRANNAGDTQDCQEHKKEHEGNKHIVSSKPTHDPSICQVRRFEMIKYSFDADDKYVAIKEHEHFNHSRNNIDACQAYR
ncbi:hypothetical protein Tco_0117248 [Tanacetum coccineum]